MPFSRSISSFRNSAAWPDRNISASHVSLPSNFFMASGFASTWRTASRFAPQVLQNFISSLWFVPQRGHNIGSSLSKVVEGYDNSTTLVLVTQLPSWYRLPSNHASGPGRNHRPLSNHRAHRGRWYGRGLQSLRQQPATRRRFESLAGGIRLATGSPPAFLSGSTRRVGADASAHPHDLRSRRRRRQTLHRDGVHRRRNAAAKDQSEQPATQRRDRHRHPDRRRTRTRARARHHSSRFKARKPDAEPRRLREDPRLRPGETRRRTRARPRRRQRTEDVDSRRGNRIRHVDGHGELHGAGTVVGPTSRSPLRRVLVWRRALRNVDGNGAVRSRQSHRHDARDSSSPAAVSRRRPPATSV